MVQTHGSVQLSTGSAHIRGLINADKIVMLRRKSQQGNDLMPIKKSVRHIMMYDKVEDEPVWTCLSKNQDGTYTGFFSSVAAPIKKHVANWTLCPAASVFWYCLRKGCNREDTIALIRSSFTIYEQ